MTRAIQEDFEHVQKFIGNYRLETLLSDDEAIKKIKSAHAKYFAALTIFHELKHKNPTLQLPPTNSPEKNIKLAGNFWAYLEEILSELGSTLFLIANGFYKAAELVLRSTLENFFKINAAFHTPDIFETKSTYEVIELSKNSEVFKSEPGTDIFEKLKSHYVTLCKSVHTADIENMQQVTALGYFPHIDKTKLAATSKAYVSITSKYVEILSLIFKDSSHEMHYKNKDIIQTCFTKPTNEKIHLKK
ncbi:hypothetical protein [Pseudomonas aeruginosa]